MSQGFVFHHLDPTSRIDGSTIIPSNQLVRDTRALQPAQHSTHHMSCHAMRYHSRWSRSSLLLDPTAAKPSFDDAERMRVDRPNDHKPSCHIGSMLHRLPLAVIRFNDLFLSLFFWVHCSCSRFEADFFANANPCDWDESV